MKMKHKTAVALEKSIKKWGRNSLANDVKDVVLDPDNCPLCQLFHSNECYGCPVSYKTEKSFCNDTPFGDCSDALADWKSEGPVGWASNFRRHAKRMHKFLISLRD